MQSMPLLTCHGRVPAKLHTPARIMIEELQLHLISASRLSTRADLRAAGQAAAGRGKPYAVLSQARLCGRHSLIAHETRFAFWARTRHNLAAPSRPKSTRADGPAGCTSPSARHSLQNPAPCSHQQPEASGRSTRSNRSPPAQPGAGGGGRPLDGWVDQFI